MRAVLATPVPVNELGLLVLKLGQHLEKVSSGRVLVIPAPVTLDACQPGVVEVSGLGGPQLVDDKSLYPLWGELTNRHQYLARGLRLFVEDGHGCQFGRQHCHKELVLRQSGNSWARICWICDQDIGTGGQLAEIAMRNQAAYWVATICQQMKLPLSHALSLPELCWFLTVNRMIDALPESLIRELLGRPASSTRRTLFGDIDTDDLYLPWPSEQIQKLAAPVAEFVADDEPPSRLMLRPKPKVWACAKYTRYVKALPCVVCGAQADDPHHLIGHGQGKMGGKAHDLFTIPLCRQHHDELHRDTVGWERKHGSQLQHLVATLDRALKEGALV